MIVHVLPRGPACGLAVAVVDERTLRVVQPAVVQHVRGAGVACPQSEVIRAMPWHDSPCLLHGAVVDTDRSRRRCA